MAAWHFNCTNCNQRLDIPSLGFASRTSLHGTPDRLAASVNLKTKLPYNVGSASQWLGRSRSLAGWVRVPMFWAELAL